MKLKNIILLGLAACALVTTSCKYIGANPAAPTAIERRVFVTQTNWVPMVTMTTNVVNVTNEVSGAVGQVRMYLTTTNFTPEYVNTPSDTSKTVASIGGSVVNAAFPGMGSIVTSGLLALLALWGHLRSSKNGNTAGAMAQQIEVLREFIKSLPQGTKYDLAITNFLQQHQMEAGISAQVLSILENQVSNPDAVAAMKEIESAIAVMSK